MATVLRLCQSADSVPFSSPALPRLPFPIPHQPTDLPILFSSLRMSPSSVLPFSPPILSVQILLERISSPWEANSGAKGHSVEVHFGARNPPAAQGRSSWPADAVIQIGSGRLFFVVQRDPETSVVEMELALRNNKDGKVRWRGWLHLDRLQKNKATAVACPLAAEGDRPGPGLTAHCLLLLADVQKLVADEDRRQMKVAEMRSVEKAAQTEGRSAGAYETSTQTERGANKDQAERRRALLRLMLRLTALRDRQPVAEGRREPRSARSQGTLTRVSIPPEGQQLLHSLVSKNRSRTSQFRSGIGYLSALHRTIVPSRRPVPERGNWKGTEKTMNWDVRIENHIKGRREKKWQSDARQMKSPDLGSAGSEGLQSPVLDSPASSNSSAETNQNDRQTGQQDNAKGPASSSSSKSGSRSSQPQAHKTIILGKSKSISSCSKSVSSSSSSSKTTSTNQSSPSASSTSKPSKGDNVQIAAMASDSKSVSSDVVRSSAGSTPKTDSSVPDEVQPNGSDASRNISFGL